MNKYLNYKNSRLWMYLGMMLGVLVMASYSCIKIAAIFAFGAMILIAAMIQPFIFYRCPYCKEGWDCRMSIPDFCPHCGHEIEY